MTDMIRSFLARFGTADLAAEDGGIGGLLLAVIVVIAIVVIALIQWVF